MSNQTGNKEQLKIVREFKAPKTLVFEAFTSADAFAAWWGPAGMTMTIKRFEFRSAGILHCKLEGNGQIMWAVFKYGEIKSPDLIEFILSFSDDQGNICAAPFPMDFPLEIFYSITLSEANGMTTLTLQGQPVKATSEQQAGYYSIMDNMEEGFGRTFNQLAHFLTGISV